MFDLKCDEKVCLAQSGGKVGPGRQKGCDTECDPRELGGGQLYCQEILRGLS